ncbi:dTDP-4-dehydrorhamnose 3,5-epimerase family protein [Pseudomonas proteolytica]|uniref:dTDP-4-dehydrorhamnose 3,5-epimerase family protein n=1 Tax=Pseudomonas proteolytica TaxID=219574 RepID=UPI0014766CEE|nr:dTDP-4-dehydrorhamnose 3,5-epimerase family protein [Pseudomonas proteolytica]NMZ42805.1 dTDP-4-keto-6-deoxy-D-glucose epimerase [Pseudomonas proteolytica]
MEKQDTGFAGCFELQGSIFKDNRGVFLKTYHDETFEQMGLRTDWKEEYYSISGKNVIRGMHFQTPPAAHAKLVYCLHGEVLDVVIDLRVDSPTYLESRSFRLSPARGNSIYIPAGLAHGFLSLTEGSVMQYKVTSVYSPEHDAGILWSSIDFEWPAEEPVVSVRDSQHVGIDDYVSEFSMGAAR